MAKQQIRIRLKAYDHRVLDQSAKRIVDTAERSGAHVVGPVPFRPRSKDLQCVAQHLSIKTLMSILRFEPTIV